MENQENCLQPEAMPPILSGDIITVYSAHQSAWGKPAQTYCVRRVESDGTPVSDMDFRHYLSDVVSISRKVGDEYVSIWKKENYEVAPWGHAYLQAFAEEMPEETKKSVADTIDEFNKNLTDFFAENEAALRAVVALGVIKMAAKAAKGVGV